MYAAVFLSVLAVIVCCVSCEDECGPPPEVYRTQASDSPDSVYVLGSTVIYRCDYGFVTGGTEKISRCIKDPETDELVWTEPEITCNPRSCGDPGFVTNARRSGSRFTFPNHVDYICNTGYTLTGTSRRYCEASGAWSGRLPSCIAVSCGRPEDPENGRAVYSSLEYKSELRYECYKGQLSSAEARLCGSDGQWTGVQPVCRDTECEIPEKPDYGTMELVGSKAKVGSIVIYRCDPGRKLVGSGSSKCTKNGEWTFPTPMCIEPCEVLYTSNGELGRYEEEYRRYRWRTVFKKVSVGTTLDENEELILKCDEDYVPRSQALREITIKCLNGKLSPEPQCITTSCLDDPPSTPNGRAVVGSRRHGFTIWYKCDSGFDKGREGAVKCVYGLWTGNTPSCVETRCNKEFLDYPGLVRGEGFLFSGQSFEPTCLRGYEVTEKSDRKIYCNKREWTGNLPPCSVGRCKTEALLGFNGLILSGRNVLDEGEWLQPVCSEGFEFSNKNDSKIYCHEGNWVGNLPPCSPAHCLNDPPVPENGRMKSIRAIGHGAVIEYECFQHYLLHGGGRVTCSYGKWTGSPPACKDSRCYLRNLPEKGGVDLTDGRPVDSNERANIVCIKGYNLRYPDVLCERGEWKMQNELSPCQEDDCQVKYIENGEMLKKKTIPIENFFGSQTGTKIVHELVAVGSSESSGATLFVKCRSRYKFQGEENQQIVEVTCRTGEWVPFPECLMAKRQTANTEAITVPSTSPDSVQGLQLNNNTIWDRRKNTTVDFDAIAVPLENPIVKESILSDNHTSEGSEELTFATTINPPCSCKYNVLDDNLIAYSGKKLLKFKDEVYRGSTVVFYCKEPGFHILRGPESVTCPEDCSWHSSVFPSCARPNNDEVIIRVTAVPERNIHVDFSGIITVIPKTKLQFRCSIPLKEGVGLNWASTTAYNNGIMHQAVNYNTKMYSLLYVLSEAAYGDSGTYTCYSTTGLARSVAIEVKDVQCPEMTDVSETGEVAVSYSENRRFNSRATFHCFSPYKRNGPSYVTCEASGHWSGPPSSCDLPTCTVGSLYDVVPENVVPYIDETVPENVTYGYELRLGCDQDAAPGTVLKGSKTASCSNDGKWKVESEVQCVKGCASLLKKNGSELLISPKKEFYGMGESIIFSCPEGKDLTEEVERILCFQTGWTPDIIPDCQ